MKIITSRLVNQRIDSGYLATAGQVTQWMGALQAQDYGQAVWAIGLRMPAATLAQVEQAIAEGKILRTWPMRGTIHFVSPNDAKWMVGLSAPRLLAGAKRRHEGLGLTPAILERSGQLMHDVLQGGKQLSRPDIMALLETNGITTRGGAGYHILWYLAQTGLICIGPRRGKQQTFVLLDEWAPNALEPSRDEALAILASRYFTSHGPATLQDFAWWTGATMADARAGLEGAKAGLVAEKIDGKEYWLARNSLPDVSEVGVHFLPGFDEYLLGYKDRAAILTPEDQRKVIPGNNGVFLPPIIVDGRLAGIWKRTVKKTGVDITVYLFNGLTVPQDALRMAAQRYADFMALPLTALSVRAA